MAEQITFLSLSNSTIGSTSDFHSNVCKLIDGATPAALHIEDLYPAYKTATGTLASVVNRRTAFVSTEALKRADQRRDRGCGTMINVVNAFKNSLVTAKSEAAAFLAPQLAPYRGIGHHEYSKQTAEVKGMLAVLNDPANADAVEALGLTDDVAELAAANAAFEELFAQKAAELADRAPVSALDSAEVTRDANARYEKIVQVVNAYAIVSPTDEINGFIHDLNGYIAAYALIAGGSSKPSGSTTDPEEPEEPEEPTDPEEGGGTPGEI